MSRKVAPVKPASRFTGQSKRKIDTMSLRCANLRARAKIISHFRIPSSGHLCPILNRKILEIVPLFLWLCDFGSKKSDLNLDANSVKLFLRKPYVQIH